MLVLSTLIFLTDYCTCLVALCQRPQVSFTLCTFRFLSVKINKTNSTGLCYVINKKKSESERREREVTVCLLLT